VSSVERTSAAVGPAPSSSPNTAAGSPRWSREVARVLGFALLYAGAVLVGRATRLPGSELALVWPAAGVSFLWLASSWSRPRALVVDVGLLAVVTIGVTLTTGTSVVLAIVLGPANVVQAGVGCWVYRRLRAGDSGWSVRQVEHLWALLLAGTAGALAAGLIGPSAIAEVQGSPVLRTWGIFVLRNAVSAFVIAAVGLRGRWRLARERPSVRRLVELVAWAVATVAATGGVFGIDHGLPLGFLVLPMGVWAGKRLPTTFATASMSLVGCFAIVTTMLGLGPFGNGSPLVRVVLVQLFVALLVALTLLLGLVRDERELLIAHLRRERSLAHDQAELLATVIDGTSDGIVVVDELGRYVIQNPAAREMFDFEGVAGDRRSMLASLTMSRPDGTSIAAHDLPASRALNGEEVDSEELVLTSLDGATRKVISMSARPITDGDGTRRAVTAFRDITLAHEQSAAVADARDLLAAVLEAATEQSVVGTDREGRITVFNTGAEQMTGWTAAEMIGGSPEVLHDLDEVIDRADELGLEPGFGVLVHGVTPSRPSTRLWTYRTREGHPLTVRLSVSAMAGADGEVVGYLGMATDVTLQLASEQLLADSELRFRSAFDTAPMGMALLSLDAADPGRILSVNPRMCDFLGREPGELLELGILELLHPDDIEGSASVLSTLVTLETEHATREVRFRRPDGVSVWASASASAVRPLGDEPPYLILIVEDITMRRLAEEQLTRQALHDHLTGLPNRTLLVDRLGHALDAVARTGAQVGVLYLDLDGFKEVNDTAGHSQGDEVLLQVAARLEQAVRPSDTVARLGGDEFAIICPEVPDIGVLRRVADRVLASVDRPFVVGADSYVVTASIGMVTGSHRDDIDRVLADADEAMYAAKRGGKNRVTGYGSDLQVRAARSTRLLPELRRALREDELVMHGQPVVDLATGVIVAVETLVRWQHPERGLLAPSEFLDVVESSALMVPVGRRVLAESCRMAATWAEVLGPSAPTLHVNVSGRQLESGNLTADVLAVLERTSMPASRLVLELTETHVPQMADSLRRDLQSLRERGVRIAIDDIGTGYSSLTRLTELPVDILKIDVKFVAGVGRDPSCDAVVRAVLGIGTALGLSVVAEGVETPQQAASLQALGCDTAQGYLYSPPRPEGDLLRVLAAERIVPSSTPQRPRA
jgi:diguanylate cyclase (GGDEF)-like protein/PAS domain S-box-containing protein